MNVRNCFSEGLLKKEGPSIEKSKRSLEIAKSFIKKAENNLDSKNYDLVLFCCYTSMFHAARAVLFRDGVKERSHICLILYLKEKYPEIKDSLNLLDVYRRSRHTALYSLEFLYLLIEIRIK